MSVRRPRGGGDPSWPVDRCRNPFPDQETVGLKSDLHLSEHRSDGAAAAPDRVAPDELLFLRHLRKQSIEALSQRVLLQVQVRFVLNRQRVIGAQYLLVLLIKAELFEIAF